MSRHPAPAAWVLRTALNVRVSWWRWREVALLRIWLDLDTATVAAELGISPSTVAVHLSRATATLRAQFVPVARTRRA